MILFQFKAVLPMLLTAAAVSACAAANDEKDPVSHENVFVGEEALFAILHSRSDGQWVFDKITRDNSEPDQGFLVRLNDLAPAFDTRPAECEPRPYRDRDRCNPLNPFRTKDVGVVGKIVDSGISAGTGGTIKSMSRTYTTRFDQLEFNAAVDQALLSSGLDENRVDLVEGLKAISEKTESQNAELYRLASNMISDYKQDKNRNIQFDLSISGLDEYYSHDLDPDEFVTVSSNTPSVPGPDPETGSADVLPCDASDCIDKLHAALRRIEMEHDARLSSLRARLDSQTNAYNVDCSKTEHDGYHFVLTCPQTLARNASGTIELPVSMYIRSRDFSHLFPQFSEQDDNLSASVQQGDLTLENRTDDFIDVQSISIYYNSHINTVTDDDGSLDLAPHQKLNQRASRFSSPEIDIESGHANMTPDKASRTSFSFGLAVKYSLRDRNAIETIYAVNDFRVQCAIENRLRPGSCRDKPEQAAMSTRDQ